MFPSCLGRHIFPLGRRYCSKLHQPRVPSLLTAFTLFLAPSIGGSCSPFMCGNSASSMSSNHVVVPPRSSHTASIIFLHGLGDTGNGWAAGFDDILRKARLDHIKVICPTAPTIPVTLNMMMRMPAWFDIASLKFDDEQDEQRIKASSNLLNDLIDEEVRLGIRGNRILIGGFSQGGAIALYNALTVGRELCGVIALSTFLPLHTTFPLAFDGTKRHYPILQCHGEADPVVNIKYGVSTRELLTKYCTDVEFKTYKGLGHSSHDQEMKDVMDFIAKQLPSIASKN